MSEQPRSWPLQLVSVVLAVILWLLFSYSERNKSTTQRDLTGVAVTYNVPGDFMVVDAPKTVGVRIVGVDEQVTRLTASEVFVRVDLASEAGIQEIPLSEDNVSRPNGVSVVSITPTTLNLEVDERVRKRLRVDAYPVGEPGAGAVVERVEVVPNQIEVTGPRRLLESRDRIPTTIDVTGRILGPIKQAKSLDLGDPSIQPVGTGTVQVIAYLREPNLPEGSGL